MTKKANPWWRDPKFVIPSILVPVILATIGLLPSILPDRVSDELLVSLSLSDPRRTGPGRFDMNIEERFVIDKESESEMAKEIAHSILKDILSNQPDLNTDRQRISVVVDLADDGRLFINGSRNDEVGLHLGRFDALNLESLIQEWERAPMVQMPVEASLPRDVSIPEKVVRAGVYRIILTAPGYRDHSVYLQLTNEGKLLTVSNTNEVVELNFPIPVELRPKSESPLIIAIRPCHTTLPASSKPTFTNIDKSIRNELERAILERGFIPILVEEGEDVGFDLSLSKGLAPTEGLVSADLLIGRCRCEWIEE